jgi:sec-independent protein translocase protein TatB
MFDVAFSELLLIMLVALVVIGPKQLPRLARTAGLLLGRVQRQIAGLKAEIERDLQTQELQDLDKGMRQQFNSIESELHQQVLEMEAEVTPQSAAGPASAGKAA